MTDERVEALRAAIENIRLATLSGKVCNDVAWYSEIETLHDFCADTLDRDSTIAAGQLSLLPPALAAAETMTSLADQFEALSKAAQAFLESAPGSDSDALDAFESFCLENRTAISSALTAASPVREGPLSDIAAERKRQIEVEGWTAAHDDDHGDGQLAKAAACYATGSTYTRQEALGAGMPAGLKKWVSLWPWDFEWWKPAGKRRNLVKAGALIVAEIERLDRSTLPAAPETTGVLPTGERENDVPKEAGCDQCRELERQGGQRNAGLAFLCSEQVSA